jgi:uncharacterized membrane protein YtjA (UPF0391 family)
MGVSATAVPRSKHREAASRSRIRWTAGGSGRCECAFYKFNRRRRAAAAERFRKPHGEPARRLLYPSFERRIVMLSWALTFLVIALIAALFGFTGIAGAASQIAQILFFVFLVLMIVAGVSAAVRGRPPV